MIPQQRISVYEAVCLFTKNAAYCTNEEHLKGTLENGKLGDFIVLDEDIFKVNVKDIHNIRILKTVLGGEEVFSCNG